MKKYVFLLIAAVIAFVVGTELRLERERVPTEAELVVDFLEDYAFVRPREVTVLLKETTVDKKRREKKLVLVLKSDEEYLPKSQRIKDDDAKVLGIFQDSVPDYDFGTVEPGSASYFHMLTFDAEWKVSTIKTSNGHFSHWEQVTDLFSASSLE